MPSRRRRLSSIINNRMLFIAILLCAVMHSRTRNVSATDHFIPCLFISSPSKPDHVADPAAESEPGEFRETVFPHPRIVRFADLYHTRGIRRVGSADFERAGQNGGDPVEKSKF